MAVKGIILFLLGLTVSLTNAAVTEPIVTVTCTEDGFTPSITYATFTDTNVAQSATATIGDGSTDCVATSSSVAADGSTTAFGTTLPYEASGSGKCGGTFSDDGTNIKYELSSFKIDITETIQSSVERVTQYKYTVECTLTKSTVESSSNAGFTVSATLVAESTTPKTGTFGLDLEVNLLKGAAVQNADFEVNNNEAVTVQIQETGGTNSNTNLKFVVERCWPSNTQTGATASDSTNVNIINNECPVTGYGATHTISGGDDQHKFEFSFDAITISGSTDPVYIHCVISVCKATDNTDACKQNAACPAKRKRRSIEDESKAVTVTSPRFFRVTVPDSPCPDNYVYDSIMRKCTNEGLLLVKGLYLDIEWDETYGNVSSNAFSTFAKVTGSHLEYLIKRANKDNIINGLKIVSAKKGSVILDVLISYAPTVTEQEAFTVFQDVMYQTTPEMSRVASFLNVRQDKVIEFVPFVGNMQMTNMEMILVIVLVGAFILIALMAGICLYKFKSGRSGAATVNNVYDNTAMEKA